MAKVNQKSMIPRLGSQPGLGRVFNRGKILDSTIKTYFGPGQKSSDTERGFGYRPPTDWPEAGSILRVPQVVWLSLAYPEIEDFNEAFFSGPCLDYQYSYIRSSDMNPVTVYVWTDNHTETVFVGMSDQSNKYIYTTDSGGESFINNFPTPTGGVIPEFNTLGEYIYDESVTNTWASDKASMMAAFEDAKTTIESLRPGRTWVVLSDYSAGNDPIDALGFAGLAAPGSDEEFFGVKLMQFTATPPAQSGTPPVLTDVSPDVSLASDDIEAVTATIDKFAGYKTVFYGPSGTFGSYPAGPGTPTFPAPPSTVAVDGQTVPTIAFTNPALLASATDFFSNTTIPAQNAKLAHINQSYRDFYAGVAAEFDEGVCVYGGDAGSVSSSDIVNMIASYFGFDPSTGKDLG